MLKSIHRLNKIDKGDRTYETIIVAMRCRFVSTVCAKKPRQLWEVVISQGVFYDSLPRRMSYPTSWQVNVRLERVWFARLTGLAVQECDTFLRKKMKRLHCVSSLLKADVTNSLARGYLSLWVIITPELSLEYSETGCIRIVGI